MSAPRDSGRRPEGEKPSGFEGVARQNGARSAIAHDLSGVMPLARQLGEKLEAKPIPRLETISTNLFRCTRADIWPPEVMSEMEAIWKGTGS